MDRRHALLAANVVRWRPAWTGLGVVDDSQARTTWAEPYPWLEIRRDDGRWVQVHSRRAPVTEAETWLGAAVPEGTSPACVAVLGPGLGYIVDVIERRWPETRVLVIEAEPSAARAFLSRRDWRDMLDTGRLTLLVGPDYAGASHAWSRLADGRPPVVLTHPVIDRAWPARMAAMRAVLRRVVFDASANREAGRELGGLYLRHTLRNLPDVLRAPTIADLEGLGRGRPAVICAAGPSLDDNLRSIDRWRAHCVLITVDTALRPLLARGVEPDFVVALDPTALNTRHLDGIGPLQHAWLVAEPCLEPLALQAFGRRVCFYRVGDNEPWPFLDASGVRVPTLPVWGSVLTAAFSLARVLGCVPLAFIGADLGYTGHRPYARDTAFEFDWARGVLEGTPLTRLWRRLISRRPLVSHTGVDAEDVPTAPHLLAFRDWLEEQCRASPVHVVNATGAGLFTAASVEQQSPVFLERLPPMAFPLAVAPPLPGHRDYVQLREALQRLTDDDAIVSAWRSSAPGLTWRDVQPLITDALACLNRAPASPISPSVAAAFTPTFAASTFHRLPELVAVIEARRHGRLLDAWALSALDNACAPYPADMIDHLLTALVDAAALIAPPAVSTSLEGRASVLPELRCVFTLPWAAAQRTSVVGLVSAAGRAVAMAGADVPVREVPPAGTPSTPVSAVIADSAREARRQRRAARRSLVALWATARLHLPSDGLPLPRLLRLLDAAGNDASTATTSPPACARLTVATPQARWHVALAIPRDGVDLALAGAVVPEAAAYGVAARWRSRAKSLIVDVRTSGRRQDTAERRPTETWLDPRWLTDRGLPRCFMGARLDDARVLLTPRHATQSLIVDRHGQATDGRPWPANLVGEIRGREWHVGWTQPAPGTLLAQRPDGGDLQRATIDALPISVAWLDDTTVAISTDRGIWQWTPGHEPVRLATLPPSVIVGTNDGRLTLDPIPLEEGRLTRQRLALGWTLDPRSGSVSPRPTGPLGQSWGHDASAGLEARAFPESGVIQIAFDEGRRALWMVWPRPRGVAWLGPSLLVWGTDGRVGLLTDAMSRLRAAAARGDHP